MHDQVGNHDHLSDKGEEYCPEIPNVFDFKYCQEECSKIVMNECSELSVAYPPDHELPIVPEDLCADWDIGEHHETIHSEHYDNECIVETKCEIGVPEDKEDEEDVMSREHEVDLFNSYDIWEIPSKDDTYDPMYEPGYILQKTNAAIHQAIIDVSTRKERNMNDYHEEKLFDEEKGNYVHEIEKKRYNDLATKEDQVHQYLPEDMIYFIDICMKHCMDSDMKERKLFIINIKMNRRYYPKDIREYLILNGDHDNKDVKSWKIYHDKGKHTKQHTNKDMIITAEYVAHHTTIKESKDAYECHQY
jgi:hypothetical protein